MNILVELVIELRKQPEGTFEIKQALSTFELCHQTDYGYQIIWQLQHKDCRK